MFWNLMLSVKSVQSKNQQRKQLIHHIHMDQDQRIKSWRERRILATEWKNFCNRKLHEKWWSETKFVSYIWWYITTSLVNWDMMKLLPPDGKVAVILSLQGPPTPYTHTPSHPCTPHLTSPPPYPALWSLNELVLQYSAAGQGMLIWQSLSSQLCTALLPPQSVRQVMMQWRTVQNKQWNTELTRTLDKYLTVQSTVVCVECLFEANSCCARCSYPSYALHVKVSHCRVIVQHTPLWSKKNVLNN